MASALALALACGAAGCKRDEARASAANAAPPAQVARALAGEAAFDLIAFDGGAALLWAKPLHAGGGIMLERLSARGEARGTARRLAQTDAGGEVLELAAAAVGRRVGVAWIESRAQEARTRALLMLPDERAPPEPTRLATTEPSSDRGRARLAVAASPDARLRVMFAKGPARCVEPSTGPCVGYAFAELGPGARDLGGQWMAVPQPCAGGGPILVSRAGELFYSVCTDSAEQPVTMAYAINVQTEYARADEVLRGCIPLGGLHDEHAGVLLAGDCGGERRVAQLTHAPRPPAEFPLLEARVTCDASNARLAATGFELALERAHPLDHLETLLPDSLAPFGARAVWTGAALLIAHPAPDGLELVRLACEGGALRAAPRG